VCTGQRTGDVYVTQSLTSVPERRSCLLFSPSALSLELGVCSNVNLVNPHLSTDTNAEADRSVAPVHAVVKQNKNTSSNQVIGDFHFFNASRQFYIYNNIGENTVTLLENFPTHALP